MTHPLAYKAGYQTALVVSAVRRPREFVRLRLWQEWR